MLVTKNNMRCFTHLAGLKKAKGFTLIELVIGMTTMVVAIGFMMSAMLPKEKESVDQILMMKAAELGQSLVNEISSKAFDQASLVTQGDLRCSETTSIACTKSSDLGNEESNNRKLFNDVDDYADPFALEDALGSDIAAQYRNFSVVVRVSYDNNFDGVSDTYTGDINNNAIAKMVTIEVTTPLGTPITFTFYKANFE